MKIVVKCTNCDTPYNYEIPETLPQRPRVWCNKCKKQFGVKSQITASTNSTKKKKSTTNPPPQGNEEDLKNTLESIENPVLFATSHIFKKMVDTGDFRWAQLFIQVMEKTNKLDYQTIKEEEWKHQAKSMNMDQLIEIVAKKESISRNTSRRLEELDDTYQYDNI